LDRIIFVNRCNLFGKWKCDSTVSSFTGHRSNHILRTRQDTHFQHCPAIDNQLPQIGTRLTGFSSLGYTIRVSNTIARYNCPSSSKAASRHSCEQSALPLLSTTEMIGVLSTMVGNFSNSHCLSWVPHFCCWGLECSRTIAPTAHCKKKHNHYYWAEWITKIWH
jgi:hypothetical protein